eukprot:m.98148 g.98148  ORF g.98148 m.98148 type:complete len:53 (-) comp9001_c0_seq1:2120-2278(-)
MYFSISMFGNEAKLSFHLSNIFYSELLFLLAIKSNILEFKLQELIVIGGKEG